MKKSFMIQIYTLLERLDAFGSVVYYIEIL